jgi:hypothetical protein
LNVVKILKIYTPLNKIYWILIFAEQKLFNRVRKIISLRSLFSLTSS